MSAPLSPAPRTRTSRSESPGTGSGCSSTAIVPSRIVAARIGGDRTCPGHSSGFARQPMYLCVSARTLRGTEHRVNMSLLPALPRIPPMWRESRIGLEAAALRRSPVLPRPRAAAGRAPPGAADPGLHGRRRLARDDGELAAAGRLLHPPHRHPRQPRLLGGGLPPPRGAARAHGRAPRRARRGHRPEPRRGLRPRARRPAAGARLGDRDARLADPGDARGPPARARADRPRQRARHRPPPRDVPRQLPARQVLRGTSGPR